MIILTLIYLTPNNFITYLLILNSLKISKLMLKLRILLKKKLLKSKYNQIKFNKRVNLFKFIF